MCTGVEIAALAGAALSAGTAVYSAKQQQERYDQEAANEKDAAKAHAELIAQAVRKEKGAARAAMAAGGTQLDTFSTINTDDIENMGARDEAMTLLTGARKARSLEYAGDLAYQAGKFEAIGGLTRAGGNAYGNWKGGKG